MERSVSSGDRMSLSNLLGKIFCFLLTFEGKHSIYFFHCSLSQSYKINLYLPEDSNKSTHLLPGLVMASPRQSGLLNILSNSKSFGSCEKENCEIIIYS